MAALAGPAIMSGFQAPRNHIDAHVHVWTNDFSEYPLASGFTPEQMKPPVFFPQEILRHATPSGVDRIVLIQMSYYRFDNSYMLDVIRRQPKVLRENVPLRSQGAPRIVPALSARVPSRLWGGSATDPPIRRS